MPTEFKIPELGENVSAGDVVRVLVKAGDTIAKDQPVLELETDKATIEVPSSVSGTIQEVKVKQGDKVKVGQVVLTLGDAAASGGGESGSARAETAASPAKQDAPAAPADKGAAAKGGGRAQRSLNPVAGGLPPAETNKKSPGRERPGLLSSSARGLDDRLKLGHERV